MVCGKDHLVSKEMSNAIGNKWLAEFGIVQIQRSINYTVVGDLYM